MDRSGDDQAAAGPEPLIGEVLRAYRAGCFPMADGRDAASRGGRLGWYRPETRAVLPLAPGAIGLSQPARVPRRLAAKIRQAPFRITTDAAFEAVVAECAAPRRETESMTAETWIDERIEALFAMLHRAGLAHSVEAWLEKPGGELVLVGGVYGLAVGRVFCAESMFARPEQGGTDASKVALVHLMRHCARQGFTLVDTQFVNPHLEQFGVVEIPGAAYQALLDLVGEDDADWLPFEPDVDAASDSIASR
ncbi:MAG: leucyl/phenylalanyl-tRNA--protein transferase [Planctomycetota bacterium]